jgi:hypothetical protein
VAVVKLRLGPVRERDRRVRASALSDLDAAGAAMRLAARAVGDVRGDRIARGEAPRERVVLAVILGQETRERDPKGGLGVR